MTERPLRKISRMLSPGVDLVDIDRFSRSIESYGRRLLRRLFTDSELRTEPDPQLLAAGFAAKEALLKALGSGLSKGASWHDLRTLGPRGILRRPRIMGRTGQLLGTGIPSVSCSCEAGTCLALAIIERKPE
ncbi:4'-phosphopantetheinyl transferase superfamily protein [Candidatus Fermentibacteria bacterium]|nr:4'-phosphopantetheinyl transferase superfamily protein [Candidatus Fermentibacteria bacterium]